MQNENPISGEELMRRNDARVMRSIHRTMIQPDYEVTCSQIFRTAGVWIAVIFISTAIWFAVFCFASSLAQASEIDMEKISMIESSGCKKKYGHYEHARGCYQITEPALKEWNGYHPKEKYTLEDMLDDAICLKVASWYINKRIPQMLTYYKIPDTVRNRIIAYNAGIRCLVNKTPLPETTKEYLRKYGA